MGSETGRLVSGGTTMPGEDVLVEPPTGWWRGRRTAMDGTSTRNLWVFLLALVCFTGVLAWWSVEHVVVRGSFLDVVRHPDDPGWAVAMNESLVDAKVLVMACSDVPAGPGGADRSAAAPPGWEATRGVSDGAAA